MPSAAVTSKGQITIPLEVRRALHLREGDRVAFRIHEDGVVEIEPEIADVRSLRGALKPRRRGVTLEEMERAISEGAKRA